ncbi:hypothetical protein DF3PB_80026 [uncultured Defluviicoccus sp.]|uniref:Uncharacterized protein n=1 Tax=metagenome TaxID=256318 RepID=A0A380TKH3_9ZZZZ|nr:hypothetical protein DF3PB_80026 [uncultured Defluviicoccus sp.]
MTEWERAATASHLRGADDFRAQAQFIFEYIRSRRLPKP